MSAPRVRADRLLVERGLAPTRAKAQEAIAAGGARADGRVILKASDLIARDAALTVEPAHPWVSRGGLKLAHALEAFQLDPAGLFCLDVGACTGGFTDVLLARGAARVAAVDVGRGQLHPRLQADGRVLDLEGVDARALSLEQLGAPPDFVVCDASFIGADKALARPLALARPRAPAVVLVKPQYEAGPGVRVDPASSRVVAQAAAARLEGLCGYRLQALIESPVPGGEGMREYLAWLQR